MSFTSWQRLLSVVDDLAVTSAEAIQEMTDGDIPIRVTTAPEWPATGEHLRQHLLGILDQIRIDAERFAAEVRALAEAGDLFIGAPTVSYRDYLASPQWGKIRGMALVRARSRCQVCNSASRLEVHHRTYERVGDEHLDDLIVLCRSCHARHHGIEA